MAVNTSKTTRTPNKSRAAHHANTAVPGAVDWEVVDRVVFPMEDRNAILPLYAIEWTQPRMSRDEIDPFDDFYNIDFGAMNSSEAARLVNTSVRPAANVGSDVFTINSHSEICVHSGKTISLCTYFNAFPAGYWRRWTDVNTVRFTAQAQGDGAVTLMRSSGRGLLHMVETVPVQSAHGFAEICVDLPMTDLMDGGFFWFDARASESMELQIRDAVWSVPVQARRQQEPTSFSIAITTFNRPTYCLRQLRTIAADDNVRARLDTIYCTDQGTDRVCDQPGFADTARELDQQLTYIRQANLGGSGGFSRGMFETLKAATSSYTMLLDDDAISEPESIIRAVQFADYCRKPTIVGGGMFHLDNRTVLYAQGEIVNRNNMRALPAVGQRYNQDYAQFPLRDQPHLHRRFDSDFNGWWMCLIPTQIMREIGLSLPVFIKYDDIEFGLRAQDAGYATVSLPGVAVWHQAWHSKDPQRTWEDYFDNRNRWICALLHSEKPTPQLLYQMAYNDVTIGLRLVYSALHLHHLAFRDVMRGPQYILDSMPTKLAEVRAAREGFSDTETRPNIDDFPTAAAQYAAKATPRPMSKVKATGIRTLLRTLLGNGSGIRDTRPAIAVTAKETTWMAFRGQSSALVTSADGNSVAWCRRDDKLFRELFMRNMFLANTFCKRFPALAEQYRAADLSSVEHWARIFGEQTGRSN